MSAADTLVAIARGEQPAGLLQTCRLITDAGEAYGIAAVSAHFRASPINDGTMIGEGDTVALIAGDTMLVAVAYDDNIAQIWRVGSDGPVTREARIDVGFDPDMTQARGDVFASASDFPDIDDATFDKVVAAGRAALAGDALGAAVRRSRLFLLRIAGDAEAQVALFAHHTVRHDDAGFRYVAVLLDADGARWFAGEPVARGWTPRA